MKKFILALGLILMVFTTKANDPINVFDLSPVFKQNTVSELMGVTLAQLRLENLAGQVLVIVSDDAVTSSNDSLETSWINLGDNANFVELTLTVDDTAHIKYYIDYRGGSETAYLTTTVDSIKTVGTTSSTLSKGIVLRGFGAAAIINSIPGANFIRYRGYSQSGAETTTSHHAILVIRN